MKLHSSEAFNPDETSIFDWEKGYTKGINSKQLQTNQTSFHKYVRGYLDLGESPVTKKHKRKVTYIDLFCGGGGLSLGVHHALDKFGFDTRLLFAADQDQSALDLIDFHFKPMTKSSDAIENLIKYSVDLSGEMNDFVTSPVIKNPQIMQFKGKIDLLVGGPPCQGHSTLNNRTRGFDPRNLLYYTMPAFAVALDIPLIIIENVRNINRASENIITITKKLLLKNGYQISDKVISAVDFGVAQTRSRHFLVASKIMLPDLDKPIKDLSRQGLSFDDVNSNLTRHRNFPKILETVSQLSDKNSSRIRHLHDTGQYDLENEKRPECHQDGHNYPSVYGRLRGDAASGTITTGFGSPGRGRYIHPHEPRMITAREAARLQSFPDWYFKPIEELKISRTRLHKIIGDAVPSLLVFPIIASLFPSIQIIKT